MKKDMAHVKLNIDRQILDEFWSLAEGNEDGIQSSAQSLLNKLAKKQEESDEGVCCKELKYSIDRLVKGLSSSRQSARHGFSVGLCQVLRNFDVVTVDSVLEAVAKQLKYTQKESKSEQGNILLGKVLAYLALIHSGRLCKNAERHLGKVTKNLLEIKKKRSYLQQVCTSAVSIATSQVDTETFKTDIYPEIETEITQGWESCTPDAFLLFLSCHKHQSDLINKKFLKHHWNCSKLICKENYERLWKIMAQTASYYPVHHLVVGEIVDQILLAPSSLAEFWTAGVDLVFGKAASSINVGLHTLQKLLPGVTTSEQISSILVPPVLEAINRAVDSKKKVDHPLYTTAKQVTHELLQTIKQCGNGEVQLATLKCWENFPGIMGKEMMSIKDVALQTLTPEAVKLHAEHLLKIFHKLLKHRESEVDDGKITRVVTDLRCLVTLQSMATEHSWHLHLLRFLALHSYWNVTDKRPDITHCDRVVKTVSSSLRKQFQDSLFKALDSLLVHKTEKSRTQSLDAYIDKIYQLCSYMKELMGKENCISLKSAVQTKVTEQWGRSLELVSTIKEKTAIDEDAGLHRAISLLILHHCVQLLVDPRNNLSVLEDIHVCYEKVSKAKGKSVSKSTKKEPDWIEVIIEVLLSMMSQGSNLARVTAKAAFGQLTGHVTPDSLKLIIEVLELEKLDDNEDRPVTFEDDEDMDEDEDMDITEENNLEIENGVDDSDDDDLNDKDDDNESSSDEDEDEEEEEDEAVDENFRNAVKSALGDAVVNDDNDGEEESEEDMSDTEMFKLDEALAAAFRAMKKGKDKEKVDMRKQLITFKLRVLDFVEILVKSRPSGDLVMDLIFPLLRLMTNSERLTELKELGKRAENIFRQLYKKAEVHGNTIVKKDKYVEAMKEAIQLTTTVSSHPLIVNISDGCLLVIRLLLNLEIEGTGPSPVKTRSQKAAKERKSKAEQEQKEQETLQQEVVGIIDTHLTDLLQKHNTKLNQAFFENLFQKYPVLFWPLVDSLMKAATDAELRVYAKTQALSLLIPLVNKETASHVSKESWDKFTTQLLDVLTKLMAETNKDNFKPQLVRVLYLVVSKRLNVAEDFTPCSQETLDAMETLKKFLNKDTKKLCNRIKAKLQEMEPRSHSEKKAVKRGSEETPNVNVKKGKLK